jgi:hypothetical protein
LGQIGLTTDPNTLRALAQALHALPAKLSEAQAQRALDAVLRGIGQTTYPDERSTLAQALLALAAKLSVGQVQQALPVATSSLAYAPWDGEPANWAQALVALSSRLADQDATNELVAAIPRAYGPAREVLLEAIRARHPDAPPKEAGTEAGLAWLGTKYPKVLHPSPVCPPSAQPTAESGLKCTGD